MREGGVRPVPLGFEAAAEREGSVARFEGGLALGGEGVGALLGGADVFLQAYRPGGLAAKGFGVADVAAARPGVVYASLNAYGWDGPWKDRRGVSAYRWRARWRS